MKHLNKFNEGWFSKDEENTPVKLVNSKIQDAAYDLGSFGTTNYPKYKTSNILQNYIIEL